MRLDDREESENVEDRRGFGPQAGIAIGGGGLILALVLMVLGVDPRQALQIVAQPRSKGRPNRRPGGPPRPVDPEEEKQAHFTKVIFGDTERIWGDLFAKAGKEYPNPTLVLFSGMVDSACGQADAAGRAVLLPGRQQGLHRPGLLQGHAAAS